jgi:chromosome segregation ATPase
MATSPAASSILTDDSTSDATFPSPNSSSSSTQPTANGSGPSRHKRTWSEANPSPDEAAPAAKAIRPSTSTNLQPTTTATDFTEHIQGEDPAFGGHILGLLARHDAALKSQKAAQTASEGLRQEVERLQGIVETRKVKEAELRNKNTGLVNEQRAAAILAKEKESTLKVSNTDLTKRLETAQEVLARTQSGLKEAVENAEKAAKEAMEKEKKEIEDGAREELEARRNTITELQRRLAEVEAQSSQYEAAITNADASRRARNEAQEELAAAKEDGYRTSNKLQEKMASLDAALIDLETSQDKLKRLKNECADQQTVKVQLAALQVKYQNIQLENRQLSNELQGVNERIAGLQAKASIADDRLLERTECEGRLATAQRTVKAQAEELKDVRERMEKSEKAEKEVRRNFNVQKAELHRLNTRNRELQGAASGHLRRVKEESGAKRENGGYRAGSGSTSTFGLSGVIDLSMDED